MEQQVFIRCREQDEALIKSIEADAIDKYRDLVVTEVKRFEGKDKSEIPIKVIYDTQYLKSIDDDKVNGCIGGFKLYARRGRIVCS